MRRESAIWINFVRRKRQHRAFRGRFGQPFKRTKKKPHIVGSRLEIGIARNDIEDDGL
jgi:hypothetical protein